MEPAHSQRHAKQNANAHLELKFNILTSIQGDDHKHIKYDEQVLNQLRVHMTCSYT